jgi:hypothetical protein
MLLEATCKRTFRTVNTGHELDVQIATFNRSQNGNRHINTTFNPEES